MRPTRRQMIARLRRRVGLTPPRGGVGAYRWSGHVPRLRSGPATGPRRVVRKRPPNRSERAEMS
jgi:hypothetical protein